MVTVMLASALVAWGSGLDPLAVIMLTNLVMVFGFPVIEAAAFKVSAAPTWGYTVAFFALLVTGQLGSQFVAGAGAGMLTWALSLSPDGRVAGAVLALLWLALAVAVRVHVYRLMAVRGFPVTHTTARLALSGVLNALAIGVVFSQLTGDAP